MMNNLAFIEGGVTIPVIKMSSEAHTKPNSTLSYTSNLV